LVWFTKWIAQIVSWIIPTPKNQEKEVFRLKYISAGPLATPELSVEQAFEEIIHFANISKNGANYAQNAINEADTDNFEELRGKLVKYEEISDRIEYEIAAFLNGVSAEAVSENTSIKIKSMYKIIGELESLGDSCETISRILSRKNIHNKKFDADAVKNLFGATADNAKVTTDLITVSNDLNYTVETELAGFAGTNSVVTFYTVQGGIKIPVATVKLVVNGDINGDGVVDVIDGANAFLVSTDKAALEGCYFIAGNLAGEAEVGKGVIDANDYSALINLVVPNQVG
jgi:hypothetical protein